MFGKAKYRFRTGRTKWAHSPGGPSFSYPEEKDIPVQDVLDAILKHIGMEITYDPAKPEKIGFKVDYSHIYKDPTATQVCTAKTARPNKQKKV